MEPAMCMGSGIFIRILPIFWMVCSLSNVPVSLIGSEGPVNRHMGRLCLCKGASHCATNSHTTDEAESLALRSASTLSQRRAIRPLASSACF